jgi:uncharacterized small protein (DUF1192 family)
VQGAGQTPVTPPAVSIDELQTQIAELTGRLEGLQAQSRVIRGQLRHAGDPGMRSQLLVKYGEVNVQIATTQGDLARVRADLATRQATEFKQVINPPSDRPMHRPFDPDLAAGLMFAFIFAVLMPISIAYARRIWRGRPAPPVRPDDALSAQRMERMEQAVDAIAIEIERISEGQRFVTKVLAARPPASQPAAQASAQPGASDAGPGLGEAQPLRALGAGPMEPIRMPERQAVKQAITPR